eukprot:g7685.t1
MRSIVKNPLSDDGGSVAVEMMEVKDGVTRLRRAQTSSSLPPDKKRWDDIRTALDDLDLDAFMKNATDLKKSKEKMKAEGFASATQGDLNLIESQFKEFVGDLHQNVLTAKVNAKSAGMKLSHSIEKEERLLKYGRRWDSLLEIVNEFSDIIFLFFNLWGAENDLFWASLTALMLSFFVRIFNGWKVRHRVDWEDKKKRQRYYYGVVASLIEPLHGNRWIKKGFKDGDAGGWEGNQYVEDRDKHAVRAENDLLTATAERNNGIALVLAEDVPEFVIEMFYLFRTGGSADAFFIMTTIGTFLHMVRQLVEARALHHEIPTLRITAECRDKVFAPTADDAEVIAFAKRGGLEVRKVNLSSNKNITDEAVKAIAEKCPHLTTINLMRCENITNLTFAEKCPHLMSIDLSYCENITNLTFAEKCPNLTTIHLQYCKNITDEAVKAFAEKCPHLTKIYLSRINITDEVVKAFKKKLPKCEVWQL